MINENNLSCIHGPLLLLMVYQPGITLDIYKCVPFVLFYARQISEYSDTGNKVNNNIDIKYRYKIAQI